MMNKIYVGNLPYSLNEASLRKAFERFGEITSVKIVNDRDTGRSRGFGFISFENPDCARQALAMGGQMLEERKLFVKYAREKHQMVEPFSPMERHNIADDSDETVFA